MSVSVCMSCLCLVCVSGVFVRGYLVSRAVLVVVLVCVRFRCTCAFFWAHDHLRPPEILIPGDNWLANISLLLYWRSLITREKPQSCWSSPARDFDYGRKMVLRSSPARDFDYGRQLGEHRLLWGNGNYCAICTSITQLNRTYNQPSSKSSGPSDAPGTTNVHWSVVFVSARRLCSNSKNQI